MGLSHLIGPKEDLRQQALTLKAEQDQHLQGNLVAYLTREDSRHPQTRKSFV
jgi:hypothetical protein